MKDIEELSENYSEKLHKTIGNNVKRIRTNKGLSQLKLAYAIGYKSVSPISSGEIYYNNIHFNIEHLYKIAYVLDVEISEFFKDIKTKKD
ncbi:helix-turn-helix transcriptional regulator [Arcobacteraceae bacterium]|nr:helix-turn-helix transcriptional regulator [Arcobacteraceae bacterium]